MSDLAEQAFTPDRIAKLRETLRSNPKNDVLYAGAAFAALDEIERLQGEIKADDRTAEYIEAQSAALTLANARIARLEEALKFYSDAGDYTAPQTGYVYGGENKLWCDCGRTARRALKGGA